MKKLRSGHIKKSSPSSQGTERGEGGLIYNQITFPLLLFLQDKVNPSHS